MNIFTTFAPLMKKVGIILFMFLMLTSCNGSQQEEQENGAEALYSEALQAFEAGNVNLCKILIDSIHSEYRMNVDVRKKAVSLMQEVKAYEDERTKQYFDSLRPIRQAQYDSLSNYFRVSGDTAYYDYVKYVHRSQSGAAPRISLIAEVKDNGDLQLISVYMGKKLDHKRVRVTNKDNFFVESAEISLDSPYNNRFDDFGTRWEYLTLTGDNMGDLPSFISSNAETQLKVTLFADSIEKKKGKKAVSYTYLLDPQDRKAIKQAVELSRVLNDINKLKVEN